MNIEVVTYQDKFKEDFARLNFDWIEKYFVIEAADRKYLLNPREMILETGGEIFFACNNEKVFGTCAMLKIDDATYELVKMAVSPEAQGNGISNHLLQAALAWTQTKNAKRIFLESNTILETAIKLYEKFGFRSIPLTQHANTEYERVNIVMELLLN